MIERQLFIRDLFNSKYILNNFGEIEFENFKTFIECVNKDTIELTKKIRITVPIKTIEEIDVFVKLASENYMCEKANFNLFIEPDFLDEFFTRIQYLKNKRYSITSTVDIAHPRVYFQIFPGYVYWTTHNPLWVELDVSYDNIEETIITIVETYMKKRYRFFKLNIDYESFEKMKLGELHKLEFWLHQLYVWKSTSGSAKIKMKNQQPIELYLGYNKTIFVSKDFKLYVTRQAFKEGDMLFDLGKNYKANGNTIPFKELNILRSYIDLPIKDVPWLDYYQNKKVMGHFNEEVFISKFIRGILQ